MKRSEFIGKRFAEYLFGRQVASSLQFVIGLTIIIKMFNFPKILYALMIPVGVSGIWLVGFLCYKFGIVKHTKRRQFNGVISYGRREK